MTNAEQKAFVIISSTLWTQMIDKNPIDIKEAQYLSKLLISTMQMNDLQINETGKNEGEK
jgi:hypothetical protein